MEDLLDGLHDEGGRRERTCELDGDFVWMGVVMVCVGKQIGSPNS